MLKVVTVLLGLFAMSSVSAQSETYYVAPLGTTIAGTPVGTDALPFASVEAAFASGKVKGGDTLLLKDGAYGAVTISANAAFDVPVTIMSQNAKAAQFDSILLAQTTRKLILKNLSVWPRDPAISSAYLVRAYTTVSDITVDGLDIRSEVGANEFMQWDAAKWNARKFSGVMLQGTRSLVTRSRLTGIYHGIMVGDDSQIINNVINGFNGDGMRAFIRSTVRGNRVSNCVVTDDNHDDGFQSFSGATWTVTGLVLDSNVIVEWTGAADHPLRCTLQGIGLFDGPYDNLTIVNNLVSTTHSHGISVYGARGAQIINNTVVNNRGSTDLRPFIAVYSRKDGTPPTDVLIANNLAMSMEGGASAENRVEFRNNSVIGTPSLKFQNPAAFDYRPKASSGYIDTADATVAPLKDVMGQKRPGGALPDRGAYETQVDGTTLNTATLLTQSAEAIGTTATGTTTTGTTTTGTTTTGTTTTGTTTTGTTTTTTTGGGGPKRIKIRTFR